MKLATLIYVVHEGKTLMLYRNKKKNDYHQGKWNGLGGKFEVGESPEECAIRELEEESGLIARSLTMKGHITFPMFDGKDDWYVFLFVVTETEGQLRECPEGQLEWIDNHKLKDLNLWAGDRIFIPWLQGEKFFSARFVYHDGEYIDHTVSFY